MSFLHGNKEDVLNNRKRFLESKKINIDNCIFISTEHKDKVTIVNKKQKGCGSLSQKTSIKAEALITKIKDIYLVLLTADCIPMVYYDNIKQIISIAHLGWRPTEKRLAKKVINIMKKKGGNPKDIKVFIGPSIRKDSYLVKDATQRSSPDWKDFIEIINQNEVKVDLAGFNKKDLLQEGILRKNIKDFGKDTFNSKEYFSHYYSKNNNFPEGRFMTVVGMKKVG